MGGLYRLTAAFVAAGATGLFVPGPSGASAATHCSRTYTAKPNDSWSRIATKVGTPMKDLLKVNKATIDTLILIGDVLCLPKSARTKGQSSGLGLKPPQTVYTPAEAVAIIREVFPKRLQARAIQIAKRESKLNAAAVSDCCLGLFQIHWEAHRSSLRALGITSAQQLLDARWNAKAALLVYKRSGSWAPWALR